MSMQKTAASHKGGGAKNARTSTRAARLKSAPSAEHRTLPPTGPTSDGPHLARSRRKGAAQRASRTPIPEPEPRTYSLRDADLTDENRAHRRYVLTRSALGCAAEELFFAADDLAQRAEALLALNDLDTLEAALEAAGVTTGLTREEAAGAETILQTARMLKAVLDVAVGQLADHARVRLAPALAHQWAAEGRRS